MPVYKIAELPILIDPVTEQTEKRLQPYLCDSAEYEFDASVSREEIEAYIEKSKTKSIIKETITNSLKNNLSNDAINSLIQEIQKLNEKLNFIY